MKKGSIICAITLCVGILQLSGATPPAPKRLPLDASVRTGQLANGMTYYIKHAANPAQRADFFIAHNVGALQEEENQNGLAHFLEHMAFNGTKHFPKKELFTYLAANGVRFGYNVNAFTSRDRTVYNISNVPLTREGVVDSLLLVLHDWSYYIACEPEEIESERGVIREEWRRGDDPRSRMARNVAQIEYAGSKYASHDVIGRPEIINNFERETLIYFYHKWYRPDMQAIIVVGDVDVDQIERKIKTVMATIPKAENPAQKEIYPLPACDSVRYGVMTDPETKMASVKLIYHQSYPTPDERATTALIRNDLQRKLFLEMLRNRLSAAEKLPDTRYKRVVAVNGSFLTCKNTLMLTGLPKSTRTFDALAGMLTDMEQIRRHGFGQEELSAAKAKVARSEKLAIEKLRRATNTDLAGIYVDHFTHQIPYMTVDERAQAMQDELAAISLEEMNEQRGELIPTRDLLILFSLPESMATPQEKRIYALLDSVAQADIAPWVDDSGEHRAFFTKELTPGQLVKGHKSDYDAEEWTLSNGARVFWRTVPEVIGSRKVGMRALHTGGFACDKDAAALRLLQGYVRAVSIGELDRNAMRELLMAHNTTIIPSLDRTSAMIKAATSPAEFEFMLQAVHLLMTDPNFSEASYNDYISRERRALKGPRSPRAIYSDSADLTRYGNHPWLKPVDWATLERVDRTTARRLYDKQFGNAADFVFFFAGEMPAAQARPLIEKYIGSLPSGAPLQVAKSDFALARGVRDFDFARPLNQTPKSTIERIYHGTFDCTAANYATLRYVTYILGARYMQTVREEKGGTYYIGVQDEVEARPRGYCRLTVKFDTDPKLREMLLNEVQSGIERLAAEAPSEAEVTEARLYFEKVLDEQREKNLHSTEYWIDKMQTRAIDGVDYQRDNAALLHAVTPEAIRQLTHSILSQENRITNSFTQLSTEK